MKSGPLRVWFCFAAAILAAALADPCVEALSNSGIFGHGQFTDRSYVDVLPAFIIAVLAATAYFALRVRRELLRASAEALRVGAGRLLPAIFALQLAVLASMETLEQLFVYGHLLGGTVWLGGPVAFSLLAHAFACIAVAYGLSRLLRAGAHRAARAIRLIRALVERSIQGRPPIAIRAWEAPVAICSAPVLCRIGNRAPPVAIV